MSTQEIFYMEADEEMISIIGRLRRSNASENIIVAPNHALIFQSIVNVRLLEHDARKNGKKIIVVTQNEQSRSLCEKVGIKTRSSLESGSFHADISNALSETDSHWQTYGNGESEEVASGGVTLPHSDTIGSEDFFGVLSHGRFQSTKTSIFDADNFSLEKKGEHGGVSANLPSTSTDISSKSTYADMKKVSVRDKNPKKLTTLNSQRFEEEKKAQQKKSKTLPSLRGATRPIFTPPPVSIADDDASLQTVTSRNDNKHPLWFLTQKQNEADSKSIASVPHLSHGEHAFSSESETVIDGGGKIKAFFVFFGIVSILSMAGVAAYLFLPKADVSVKLKVATQKSDFEFEASSKTETASLESEKLPARLIEKDQDIALSFDATGKSSFTERKSRGRVTVYNEYSSDPQVLVASTRLLSKEGKIFRLANTVTVPGFTMKENIVVPGSVEVAVVADQSGEDYNAEPTEFTIPGFKDSPKYTKFFGKSSLPMTGGGSDVSTASLVVSDQDVALAKKVMDSKLKELAEDAIQQDLRSGERVMSDAFEVVLISGEAYPSVKTPSETFEYRAKIHIKALVFSEDALKSMIRSFFEKQNGIKGTYATPNSIELQYGEPTADFVMETLHIKVHAVGRFESSFDKEQLKGDLLGQSEDEITNVLKKYTQIESISIELWPEFLAGKIPSRESRVHVNVVDVENSSEGK